MYEINNDGVLFRSPPKNLEGATQVQQAEALQFYSTQQSSNHGMEAEHAMEQDHLEQDHVLV